MKTKPSAKKRRCMLTVDSINGKLSHVEAGTTKGKENVFSTSSTFPQKEIKKNKGKQTDARRENKDRTKNEFFQSGQYRIQVSSSLEQQFWGKTILKVIEMNIISESRTQRTGYNSCWNLPCILTGMRLFLRYTFAENKSYKGIAQGLPRFKKLILLCINVAQ